MAINKNHEFEDLDGVKCSIVEKNASKTRVEFLKNILEYNGYRVIVIPTPPAKVAPAPKPVVPASPATADNAKVPSILPQSALTEAPSLPPAAETFTVGVTDVMFNSTNAIFGRLLHTPDGHVVTLAYWEQKENVAHDEIPYFENNS
ncbi:MAG: hypothetical protein ABJA71_00190 [Ginsengibacter sp.]